MNKRFLAFSEVFIIVVLACVPLFATFPYRINIFISWEGAYRLSQGQLPFKDFGTPIGGAYWLIPGIFFKLLGSQMITLIKAQVFINIIAGLAFRSIFSSLSVNRGIRFVAVLLFCLSYSFFNFWPWYNHTVIVYEIVALAFLFKYTSGERTKFSIMWLAGAALFVGLSFLTKQDAGGITFLICCALLAYNCFAEKKWRPLVAFIAFFGVILTLIILPFTSYRFGYWFNHGQPPHTSRISVFDIVDEFLGASDWIKFYLFIITLLLIVRFRTWKEFLSNKTEVLFTLLTLAIMGEAAVFQVTSYTPPDNNIFFHSFAIVFILALIAKEGKVNFNSMPIVLVCVAGILLWWSSVYWKYVQSIAARILPAQENVVSTSGENMVNKKTYRINKKDTLDIPLSQWVYSDLKVFKNIYMPKPTVDGIKRLLSLNLLKSGEHVKVLNMSELTPLAAAIPYELERNDELPLWHHLGVGMFNKEAAIYERRIQTHHYDLILFEYIPGLNNFYPFKIRDALKINYKMIDSFAAPRRGDGDSHIEVYVKP